MALVSVTALPGVLPLLVVHDPQLGLRLANVVQICLLFFVGHRWARLSGGNPWRTGLVIMLLAVALVLVALLFGG
jgi:VIT1/CCC1 family predicted Fe2+/Mn2+ transporter